MNTQVRKLADDFVAGVTQTVRETLLGNLKDLQSEAKPRGMASFTPEERSAIAKKAALTRKRRAAARKAADTKRRQRGL